MHNVLFQIKIDRNGKMESNEPGYAFIAKESFYFNEEEVLFNPLNTFKVCDVSRFLHKKKLISSIKLIYVELDASNLPSNLNAIK